MKITGGKYRGKTIQAREERTLRPTSSRIRETIFNILRHGRFLGYEEFLEDENPSRVEGRKVVDIFCGTGALGIEALSHGAAHITFIDQNPKTLSLARDNVDHIGEIKNASFVRSDSTNLPPTTSKADLVFIDPPYNQNLAIPALKSLVKNNWLENGAIIIVEHGKTDDLTHLPDGVIELDHRMHDKTRLTILQYQPK